MLHGLRAEGALSVMDSSANYTSDVARYRTGGTGVRVCHCLQKALKRESTVVSGLVKWMSCIRGRLGSRKRLKNIEGLFTANLVESLKHVKLAHKTLLSLNRDKIDTSFSCAGRIFITVELR